MWRDYPNSSGPLPRIGRPAVVPQENRRTPGGGDEIIVLFRAKPEIIQSDLPSFDSLQV
jgi:hypothetical protein